MLRILWIFNRSSNWNVERIKNFELNWLAFQPMNRIVDGASDLRFCLSESKAESRFHLPTGRDFGVILGQKVYLEEYRKGRLLLGFLHLFSFNLKVIQTMEHQIRSLPLT